MRTLPFAAAASIVLACSSSDPNDTTSYQGDPLAAIRAECEFRFDHKGCDGQCTEDALNINHPGGASCPGSKGLFDDPKALDPFFTCRNACTVTKKCSPEPITEYDCACTAQCASKLSKRLQGMLAYDGDCYRNLPRCQ